MNAVSWRGCPWGLPSPTRPPARPPLPNPPRLVPSKEAFSCPSHWRPSKWRARHSLQLHEVEGRWVPHRGLGPEAFHLPGSLSGFKASSVASSSRAPRHVPLLTPRPGMGPPLPCQSRRPAHRAAWRSADRRDSGCYVHDDDQGTGSSFRFPGNSLPHLFRSHARPQTGSGPSDSSRWFSFSEAVGTDFHVRRVLS